MSGDKVVFGATVTLLDEDDKKVRYQLVGQTEADARVGRISYNSPLGRALIGRQKGDEVDVSTPAGDRYYEIAKIEFIWMLPLRSATAIIALDYGGGVGDRDLRRARLFRGDGRVYPGPAVGPAAACRARCRRG